MAAKGQRVLQQHVRVVAESALWQLDLVLSFGYSFITRRALQSSCVGEPRFYVVGKKLGFVWGVLGYGNRRRV